MIRKLWLAAVLAALVGCATASPSLPPPPVHANGGVLWRIISTQCLPGQARGDPAPCVLVSTGEDAAKGFVVLKDREGVAQHLLMPSDRITGIEDPKILAPGATNYFRAAWDARRFTNARLPRPLARDETSVAVNSIYGRSQDQLHLHVDCLAAGVRDALKADAGQIGTRWSRRRFLLNGHPYWARRIGGDDLGPDPFRLLADEMPGAARAMGAWTLVLAGAGDPSGGFYLLADRADPAAHNPASGEELQDHKCAGVAAQP
jgi:CDP-diacylglycerol pyrophosphatase